MRHRLYQRPKRYISSDMEQNKRRREDTKEMDIKGVEIICVCVCVFMRVCMCVVGGYSTGTLVSKGYLKEKQYMPRVRLHLGSYMYKIYMYRGRDICDVVG